MDKRQMNPDTIYVFTDGAWRLGTWADIVFLIASGVDFRYAIVERT